MNTQKTLIASLLGGLTLFGLGFVIYVLLFNNPEWAQGEGFAAASRGENMVFPLIIVFELIYGFILAYIFGKWAGIKTFSTGLKEGAFLGLLFGLVAALWSYATLTIMTESGVAFWVVTFVIRFAIAGGVIGWYYGRGTTDAS